jgi:hypothetical protein
MRFRQQVGAGSSGTLSMPNDGMDNYFHAREKAGLQRRYNEAFRCSRFWLYFSQAV